MGITLVAYHGGKYGEKYLVSNPLSRFSYPKFFLDIASPH